MQLIIFLLLLGFTALFVAQNLQPIQLVFLGGILTLTLPLAFWLVLFILAGILTSLFLQILPRAKSKPSQPSRDRFIPSSPPPEPKSSRRVPPSQEKDPLFDDWEISQNSPPPEPREFPQRKVPEKPSTEEEASFEVPRSPEKVSQNGTIHSYTYRDTVTPVFDANYRILNEPTPPVKNTPETDEDEEEWV
jgi:hypothetical protein